MSTGFFGDQKPVRYEGPESRNPLAFRWYDASRKVLGKTMGDHFRFAVCYWHSFAWPGTDPFGGPTFLRPWFGDSMEKAKLKADVAFEMFELLGVPFFTFHDRDIAPEGASLASQTERSRDRTIFRRKCRSRRWLLWGTANMFSNRRFGRRRHQPDPDGFAGAAQ